MLAKIVAYFSIFQRKTVFRVAGMPSERWGCAFTNLFWRYFGRYRYIIGSAGATKRGKVPYRASDVDLWYGSVFFDLARAQYAGDAWGRVSDILTCPIAWVICLLFEWQFLKV